MGKGVVQVDVWKRRGVVSARKANNVRSCVPHTVRVVLPHLPASYLFEADASKSKFMAQVRVVCAGANCWVLASTDGGV